MAKKTFDWPTYVPKVIEKWFWICSQAAKVPLLVPPESQQVKAVIWGFLYCHSKERLDVTTVLGFHRLIYVAETAEVRTFGMQQTIATNKDKFSFKKFGTTNK